MATRSHLLTAQGEVKILVFKGLKLFTASLLKRVSRNTIKCSFILMTIHSLIMSKIVLIDLSKSLRVGARSNMLVHKGPNVAVLFQKGPAFNIFKNMCNGIIKALCNYLL